MAHAKENAGFNLHFVHFTHIDFIGPLVLLVENTMKSTAPAAGSRCTDDVTCYFILCDPSDVQCLLSLLKRGCPYVLCLSAPSA